MKADINLDLDDLEAAALIALEEEWQASDLNRGTLLCDGSPASDLDALEREHEENTSKLSLKADNNNHCVQKIENMNIKGLNSSSENHDCKLIQVLTEATSKLEISTSGRTPLEETGVQHVDRVKAEGNIT